MMGDKRDGVDRAGPTQVSAGLLTSSSPGGV